MGATGAGAGAGQDSVTGSATASAAASATSREGAPTLIAGAASSHPLEAGLEAVSASGGEIVTGSGSAGGDDSDTAALVSTT